MSQAQPPVQRMEQPPVVEPGHDHDTAELFFSLDITAEAFLWEQEHAGPVVNAPAPLFAAKQQDDLTYLGTALLAMLRDWASNPRNAVYLGMLLLIVLLVLNFKPISDMARERITMLLPPEIEVPKPPPPLPTPPPPEPTPPPEQTPPPTPEPIPDEELDQLRQERPEQMQELRDNVRTQTRQDQQMPGVKVDAARRDDAVADLPKAFGNTDRRQDDARLGSLSNIGTRRSGPGDVGSGGGSLNVGTGRGGRKDGDEGTGNLAPLTQARKPAEETGGSGGGGVWRQVDNLGPLAHLNSRCFGKAQGEIVFVSNTLKLKCGDNQIVAAWRKE